jgi:dienelactone hydrolase
MKKTKFRKIFFTILIFLILSILTTSVSVKADPVYILDDPCVGFEALEDTQIYCGELNGAGYRIEVPENWNGDLFMYAHGYRLFYSEFLWVDDPPIREWLIENGYAWAASSFSANQLDITVGVKDTKDLMIFFQKEVGKPEHVYISGDSMGGGIALTSVEQWPNLYDGGMPTCGLLAPYEELDVLWDYYVLINALAEYDATYPIPEDFFSSGDYASAVNQLTVIPGYFPFLLNPQGMQLKNAIKMLTGGERPLFSQGFNLWFGLIDSMWGFPLTQFAMKLAPTGVKRIPIDNWETIYQFDSDPALSPEEQALNDVVFRIQRAPQAMHPNGLKNMPVNNGKLRVPVLTLHGIGDLFVPFSQEQIYAQRVADQGSSDLLVQRAIRDIVHCEFTEEEYTTAFSNLVDWVETGEKPPGDDVLNPDVVSDPLFGCQFTSEDRDYSDFALFGLVIPTCP